MKPGPKIRGRKIKSVRIDPDDLSLLRKELQDNPSWGGFSDASDSEILRLAVMFARLHIENNVYVMTIEDINHIVDEAVRINIGEVAQALGGVAQMGPDKTISVMKPGADSVQTFPANVVKVPPSKTAALN